MGDKYAVDNESAGKVATDTETAIVDLDAVKTSITDPLTDAEGGLPPEFANALAWLKTLRENHERDVDRIKTYATGCVGALRACLTVYENSSAEMVAQQKATEAKVVFEHGTAFTSGESRLNDWANGKGETPNEDRGLATVNKSLPSTTEAGTNKHGYEQTTSNGGDTTATHTSHSSTGKGYSTSEDTYTAANTHNGVTDTTTYYNSTSTRGEAETKVSKQDYTVAAAR
jgi:hypothetical protein